MSEPLNEITEIVATVDNLTSTDSLAGAIFPSIAATIDVTESNITETLRVGATGPVGPAGPAGPIGLTGEPGSSGADGTPGLNIYSGNSIPLDSFGKNSETFVNVENGDVYVKSNDTWSIIGNIQGPIGPRGLPGSGVGGAGYQLTTITNNEVWSELLGDDFSRLTMPNNTTWFFTIRITGRRIDQGGEDSASYKLEGSIENNNNVVSLSGITIKTVLAESNSEWDVTLEANENNEALVIKVKGVADVEIKWLASVTLVEVTDPN